MTTEEAQQERQDVDIEATVMSILGKQEPDQAVSKLLKDNFSQRERMRALRADLQATQEALEAEKAKETADNTEELAKLAKWQELGDYDDVKSNLDKLTELGRDNDLRQVADAAEMNFQVLKDLDRLNPDIVLLLNSEGIPVVKRGDTETPLDDYATTEWSTYEPSLRKTAQGTRYIHQTSGSSGSKGTDLATQFIQGKAEARKKGPSPFKKG